MTDTARANVVELTVSEVSQALKRTVEDNFSHVRVRGEISGYRGPHSSGHVYFAIKDEGARLDAVIWKMTFNRLRFKPEEGLEVVTAGQGFLSMGPACDELERLLIKQEITTNNNPVLDWCSANVVVIKDPTDAKKPDKLSSPEKIDGIVAMLNAIIGFLAKSKKEPPKKGADKIYSKRGMRRIDIPDETDKEMEPAA